MQQGSFVKDGVQIQIPNKERQDDVAGEPEGKWMSKQMGVV
jgi:hypothetical protein